MARDKNRHIRREFLLDASDTADVARNAWIAAQLRPGYSLADLMRDLIDQQMGDDTLEAQQQPAPDLMVMLVGVQRDIADALGKLVERPAAPPDLEPPAAHGEVESVGIDQSRPRRPKESRGQALTRRLPPPDRTAREN